MSQRPTDEQLGDLLKTPHFGEGSHLPPSEPITPTPMVLTLSQIKPYDRNPRRERNPRYDDIKESIQAQEGLNNQISVTRRPGDELYMIESGGNTRLQILNELYKETGLEVFNQIHVLYRPWKDESHVLAAHLIENDKRGDMLFIDKALGIRDLKEMFGADSDTDSLSLRQLTERLRAIGYSVDPNLLSRMNYAIDVLLPAIPEALRAGMGRPQIARIRKIEKAFQQYWTEIAKQDSALFDELFQDCLVENNRPEWDSEVLRQTLEERITELLDVPTRELRLDMDALLRGREIETPSPSNETTWQPTRPEQAPTTGNNEASIAVTPDNSSNDTDRSAEVSTPAVTPPPQSNSNSQSNPSAPTLDDGKNNVVEPEIATTLGIAELRFSIYETAYQLASLYQLEASIQTSQDWGLGFLIDLPEQPLISENNQELDAKQRWYELVRQWVWWLLYVCSEETARPERIPNLPESMTIRQLCLEGNQQALMQYIGQPTWISLSYQLLADPLIPDDHFKQLITLIQQCRMLRQQIDDANDDPLWLERNNYAKS